MILKKIKLITSIFIIIILGLFAVPFSSSAATNDLSAAAFVKQMKTGWNLGNSLDSHYGEPTGDGNLSQETIWGNPRVSKQQIDFVKSQGFDVIRVPVSWYTHTYRDSNGTIHISSEWLNRVREVVDYCISDGLYVIIDSHHDDKIIYTGVSDETFNQVKADASSIWAEISNFFAGYDQHLIFESFNEVDNLEQPWSYGKKAASQMNELNQIFVNIVRGSGGNNSQRLLMVPTLLDQSGYNYRKAFRLPSDPTPGRLIVTVHKYSQIFDQSIDAVFSEIQSFSKSIGAPIIIGEWGTTSSFSPAEYRGIHASNYIARANAHGIKCIYWDNGSNYAIIDRNNLSANTAMISAIMNPDAYTSNNTLTLANWNNYLYKTIHQTTGDMIEDKTWGSIVLAPSGSGFLEIPSGKTKLYVGLFVSENMSSQRIHYIYFFDSNNVLLSKINESYGFLERTVDIPAGATHVRIGINNSYSRTSEADYKKAVESGNLYTIIAMYE